MELLTESLVINQPMDSRSWLNINGLISVDVSTVDLEREVHDHDEAQLIYVETGIVTFYVEGACWFVPADSAMWIPAGIKHSMSSSGSVHIHCIYVDCPQVSFPLTDCCTLRVSPLTRALIIEMAKLPNQIDASGPYARLVRALLDQVAMAQPGSSQLAMPVNPKLRRLAEYLLADPSDRRTVPEWARKIGMSQRTLQRALLKETGMSFGRWRRQFHMLLALQSLAKGSSVQAVAYSLGYENTSAFIDMFRKTFGKPPTKFMTEGNETLAAHGLWDRRNLS